MARAKNAKGATRILWRKAARKIEEGRQEEGRKDQEQKMENEPMKEITVPNEADAVGSGVTRNAVSVAQSTKEGEVLFSDSGLEVGRKDWLDGAGSGLKQKWDCSQVEGDFEGGDVTDWLEDDEKMKQWEDVSKKEDGRKEPQQLKVCRGHGELLASQVSQVKQKEEESKKKKKKKSKVVAGWSTEKMEEKESKQEFKDTKDMVQWRSFNSKKLTVC